MTALYFLLVLLAVVCFALAAFRVATVKVDFHPLGLVFFALVPLLQLFQKL